MLRRRIRLLVAATITYNVIEAVIAISAGAIAESTALTGFGFDSVIEVGSAVIVSWQFAGAHPERRERTALRVIAASFVALAAYVTFESISALVEGASAEHSPVDIVLAAVSLALMPFLSHAQRRAGREYGSASAVADPKQTLLDRLAGRRLLLITGTLTVITVDGRARKWPFAPLREPSLRRAASSPRSGRIRVQGVLEAYMPLMRSPVMRNNATQTASCSSGAAARRAMIGVRQACC